MSRLLKLQLYALIVSVFLICIPLQGIAHSGRTDSSGGHHDNKNKSGLGSYHYHCGGHPAHLHTNGICPYDTNTTNVVTKAPVSTKTPVMTKAVFAATATTHSTNTPKIYNTAMPVFAYSDDRDDISTPNKENDWSLLYFCLAGLTIGITALSVSRYVKRKITNEVKVLVEKESFDLRLQFYSNLFSRHTPKELAVVPNDLYFRKDGLPIEAGKPYDDYGKFLVYISDRGNCFHKKCGCSNALTESHLFTEIQRRVPCSRCVAENAYEYKGLPKWYTEYLEYTKLQENFASTTKKII